MKPFKINDEWYYHMRFRDDMEGVTPILTDLPPKQTVGGDGSHSGNPAVREAIAKGEPQHMAWATERPGGGRGFGCSGGHVHWNWGQDQFRKLFLNAIAWTAGLDIPSERGRTRAPSPSTTCSRTTTSRSRPTSTRPACRRRSTGRTAWRSRPIRARLGLARPC